MRSFLVPIGVFGFLGAWAVWLSGRNYFRPYAWNIFIGNLPWGIIIGLAIGLILGLTTTIHSPFPRAMQGQIVIDKVENGTLWFHNETGKMGHLSLPKLVVNQRSDTEVHFGLPPKILRIETATQRDTAVLLAALRGKVRILRTSSEQN
jgi:hypothetical protein